ncbi:MAG: DUF3999 family protein, partial [Phycisphaerae bacterium]|nr:DUF3999 family protein [Phycisphaerae bacterium]
EAPQDINRIRLHTPSRNFRRAARIEGSSDLKQWSVLRDDASIFDFSADVRAAFTTLRFPASRFRYIRVTILDDGQEPLKIAGATVLLESKLKKSAPELLRTWPVANMQRKELVEEKQTEIILDLACRNVPSQEIEFEIPAVNFWRNVSLEISNDRKRWRRVSGGTVFNFKTDRYNRAETVLKYPERAGRYIRVVIHNQDDAPIEISSVTVRGQRRHVYFPVPAAGSYRVYMGNPKAWTAQYEFAKVFPHLSLAGAARVTVGKVEKNPGRIVVVKQEPWAERNKWVIYLAMIIVVIVLGWLAINVWGRLAKEPDAAA